jgi:hypothetical protein
MRRVLVYIEPHPVRNYYEEFYDVGLLLCEAMYRLGLESGYEFRYLSNDAVIDRMITEKAHLSHLSMRMTSVENSILDSYFGQWGTKTISDWLSIVRGEGDIADFYISALKRTRTEYNFDAVLLWSDNGAVRRFCEAENIVVMHTELGPTRTPFPKTIYFDPMGTNGAASVLKAPLSQLEPEITIPRETWVTRHGKSWNDEKKVGLIDVGLTLDSDSTLPLSHLEPYIFIPLQLADDLNTQLYSQLKTPVEFLEHVIPQALKLGLKVVIKGHPAAAGRPFNLIAETKALKTAANYGEDVIILPRSTSPFDSIKAMSQAVAVCTINSSVGFEALLLGKKTILLGDAAFDVGGKLNIGLKPLSISLLADNDDAHLDKLTSFLLNHYLHPIESVTNGPALQVALDILFDYQNEPKNSLQFWNHWISSMRFGYQWLCGVEQEWATNAAAIDTGNYAGNRRIAEIGNKSFIANRDSITISGNQLGMTFSATLKKNQNLFVGFVDSMNRTSDDSGTQITGWSVEKQNCRPPIQILFCKDSKIISAHRSLTIRRDVGEALGQPITPRCGFTFDIHDKNLQDIDNCSLILISSSNEAQIFKLGTGSIH